MRGWPLVRNVLLVAYVGAFVWSFDHNGLPIARMAVLGWVAVAFVVGNIGNSWRSQTRMVRDLALYAAMWIAYDYSRGVADTLGFPLQVRTPHNVDRALFLGHDPIRLMQNQFLHSDVRWYDVLFSIVYFTHFLLPVAASVYLWIRWRDEWVRYIRRFATVLFVGVATFVVLPTAPPWMAADKRFPYRITTPYSRTTGRGWTELGLDTVTNVLIRGRQWANPTAAFPSLHAAFALFVVLFFWNRLPRPWMRWASLSFPVVMALSLVYFAEHYVIDVLGGWFLVLASFWFWGRWEKRREPTKRSDMAEADTEAVLT